MTRIVRLLAAILCIAASFTGPALAASNILLIFGEDMGVETLGSYGLGDNPPTTATLDEMAREGHWRPAQMRCTSILGQEI